ncbi:hypothetical protein A5481_30205 [Methylobacterium platani]|uniref:Prenyltransferase n=2 Tax=Methylobacterium platani TaxID=427683 RepID=A0A179RY08_9HYPH|nr:hypothetical protein A5481_30205 [Methylobacterium platani]
MMNLNIAEDLPLCADVPLCVDLDGTLVRTDMLYETVLLLARRSPTSLFQLPLWLAKGKAEFKRRVAERVELDASSLPYRPDVIALVEEARGEGRQVVLATAASATVARNIADHLDLFDDVISSTDDVNLSGHHKADALLERYGEGGFDYIGNHWEDLPVMRHARRAWLVSDNGHLRRAAARSHAGPTWIEAEGGGLRSWIRALRAHQWVKNILIFVPLLAAQEVGNLSLVTMAVLAFIAYSLLASAVYLVNDMLDLTVDRRHRSKRNRPFAAGKLPISHGIMAVPVLVMLSWGIAAFLPVQFMIVLGVYTVVTTLYSFWLKQQVVVDVMLLAGLYTLRILAGAAATQIEPSFWLLAFSMFLFLSLAVLKRYSELRVTVTEGKELSGRGYLRADLPVLLTLGGGSGLISVMILAFYTQSEIVPEHYPARQWLWLVPPLMLYWVVRIWMKVNRGEMHDDPVLFAVKDWQSLVVFGCMGVMFGLAAMGLKP